MEKKLTELIKFCKANKIELNINTEGTLSLWVRIDKSDLTLDNVKPVDFEKVVETLVLFKRLNWKSC